MDDLEKKAAFKFPEITEGLEENSWLVSSLIVAVKDGNTISSQILTSKVDQQIRDNAQHAEYLLQKRKSSLLSIVAIFVGLSGAAISLLTLVATGKSVEIIAIVKEFISSIGGL